ncbi:MAG: ribosome biogenesis GTPase YlqF [Clostridiales bacterium]|nr:ribosome biogenesis GTPase YlqF [Clostridiales bacterium]
MLFLPVESRWIVQNNISWFPGHMAKARRLLADQLQRIDAVIELCDARLPLSSRNPDLDPLVGNKPRVLLLNKSDLANPAQTKAWQAYFQNQGLDCMAIEMGRKKQSILNAIVKLTEERVARSLKKGIHRSARAMVLGVPNVGKSTLINYLAGRSAFKVQDRPGVTRAPQWIRASDKLELLDTPGLLWPKLDDPVAARRLAYIAAVRDEVVDVFHLALSLLDELMDIAPQGLMNRYKIADVSLRGQELLEAICRNRGFLIRGGEVDLDRGAVCVLDEFRDGRLGRITLETLEE